MPAHERDAEQVEIVVRFLQQADVFRDLPLVDLRDLAPVLRRRSYRRGALIEALEDDAIFLVALGSVRLSLPSADGREVTVDHCFPGEVFELDGRGYPQDATVGLATAHDTRIYALPWSQFLEIVAFRPGAAASLATLFRQGRLEDRRLIRELAFYNVKTRLAHKLSELARVDPDHIVQYTRAALAAMIGTREDEVSKVLRQFRESGLVAYEPHSRGIRVSAIGPLASYGKEPL